MKTFKLTIFCASPINHEPFLFRINAVAIEHCLMPQHGINRIYVYGSLNGVTFKLPTYMDFPIDSLVLTQEE